MTRNLKAAKYTPTVGGTQRTFDGKIGELLSLKDFGAIGNGTADDTAAVQDAVDTQLALFVPAGNYKITSPITYTSLRMYGERAAIATLPKSRFFSTFGPEPMFHRVGFWMDDANDWQWDGTSNKGAGNHVVVSDIIFENSHAAGCCFQTIGITSPSMFERCGFQSSYRGLIAVETYNTIIHNCNFSQGRFLFEDGTLEECEQAIALYVGAHTSVIQCSFKGCGQALVACGMAVTLQGLRVEEGMNGIRLGEPSFTWDPGTPPVENQSFPFNFSTVSDVYFELNRGAMRLSDVNECSIFDIGFTGYGSSIYGLRVDKCDDFTTFDRVSAFGSYNRAAVVNNIGRAFSIRAANGLSTQHGWENTNATLARVASSTNNAIGINVPHYSRHKAETIFERKWMTFFPNQVVRGLRGMSSTSAVQPNNLGGIQAVGNGATTAAVAFEAQVNPGLMTFSSIAATADGSSTLPAGTWYYAMSALDGYGVEGGSQTSGTSYRRSVVITAGQRASLVFSTTANPWTRRVYRGTAADTFQGYWDIPASQATFNDTNLIPFTGTGGPVDSTGLSPWNHQEADANYAIVATPSWNTTTCFVTNKATTGFTLNFTAAPDANQTVVWLLFRP